MTLLFVLCLLSDIIYPSQSQHAPKLILNEFLIFLKSSSMDLQFIYSISSYTS